MSWCDLVYHLIITRLCLGTPAVLKLEVASFLKLEEKVKLIHIQTLESKSCNLFTSAALVFYSYRSKTATNNPSSDTTAPVGCF